MANTTISPNMNLPIPTVSVDPGPDWATNVDACLNAIDSHNHSTGQGVQINPAGININSDLAMNGNNLTSARSVRFNAQASPLSAGSDLGCLYESGVDLYYNDGSGNQIRLTASGNPAGGAGSITGLPSGSASASYSAGTFVFQGATNTPAIIQGGPLKIARNVANGKGVTISAAASTAADFNMTLPSANPSATSLLAVSNTGVMSFQTVTSSSNNITATPIHSTGPTVTITQNVQYTYTYVIGSIVFVQSQVNYTISGFTPAIPATYTWTFTLPNATTTLLPSGLITDLATSTVSVPVVASGTTLVTYPSGTFSSYTGNVNGFINISFAYIIN